jgi:hypothetical protein
MLHPHPRFHQPVEVKINNAAHPLMNSRGVLYSPLPPPSMDLNITPQLTWQLVLLISVMAASWSLGSSLVVLALNSAVKFFTIRKMEKALEHAALAEMGRPAKSARGKGLVA